MTEIRRVAIVNRGEAAMRFIHAARDFGAEVGRNVESVALFTTPDRASMFVREADLRSDLGDPFFIDERDGQRKSSYLDFDRLIRAIEDTQSDAVWVGWGFVAEDAAFADLCASRGLTFVGPSGSVMRKLGDKISSKRMAEQANVPVAAWSGGPVETIEEARSQAERLGFPLMVKATAGGGGRGIRKAHSRAELDEAFDSARSEALKGFGDATVFLERMVTGARHIEVQIMGDKHGTVWALGVRDCTLQRRQQKVLEESPSPVLTAEQDREVRAAAARLGEVAGYENAGTVEFLYDPVEKRFSFMEVNARLQVEHPVTEITTGVDLVKLQLRVAEGGRLEGDVPVSRGHAIEARLNAEDPDNNFSPAPGLVQLFRVPIGPGVRVDTGVGEGDQVAPEFDSMIAKIIAHGHDRAEAMARLRRGLRECAVVLGGGTTNKSFLLHLVGVDEVNAGDSYDIGWLDQQTRSNEFLPRHHADIALLSAAIDVYREDIAIERARFLTSAVRGRPTVGKDLSRAVELRHRGHTYRMRVRCLAPDRYRVDVDGSRVELRVERHTKYESSIHRDGQRYRIVSSSQGFSHLVDVDGVSHRIAHDEGGLIRAPSPAVVLAIHVQPGDEVLAGDRLFSLEAMKTEIPVLAPGPGRVRELLVQPNVQVETGAALLRLEPNGEPGDTVASAAARVSFQSRETRPTESEPESYRDKLNALGLLVRGFDVEPREIDSNRLLPSGEFGILESAALFERENELLEDLVGVVSLFRRRSRDEPDESAIGSEQYFVTYLRAIGGQGEGLPASFVDKLRRALTRYGVDSLHPSPKLEDALFRIYCAHEHFAEIFGAFNTVLSRRLTGAQPTHRSDDSYRDLLGEIIRVTRDHSPGLCDSATEIRYRTFDRPLFEGTENEIYAQAEADLAQLVAEGDSQQGEQVMRALVNCTHPLAGLFVARCATASTHSRRAMREVVTRRYYRIRELENVSEKTARGISYTAAEYDHDKRITLLSCWIELDQLADAIQGIGDLSAAAPADHDVVADLLVWSRIEPSDVDSLEREIRAALNQARMERSVRRVCAAIAHPGTGMALGRMYHFTFRAGEDGYREERVYRGIHPMMAKRLQLWRLENFEIERLPSQEDVYLFRAVARENPRDERLFAFVEVRDATPIRDESGRAIRLPLLERMLNEALAGIRIYQSSRSTKERAYWNRVVLYVWPALDFDFAELNGMVRSLAPATEGLGLQKVVVRARMPRASGGELEDTIVEISAVGQRDVQLTVRAPSESPIRPLGQYEQKVVKMRQLGFLYPYEITRMLSADQSEVQTDLPPGEFTEYDLGSDGRLAPVSRAPGGNEANLVVGVIRNFTAKYPEGMDRVILLGDPSKSMGSLAEAECVRVIQALDLAESMAVPLEWFPLSSGAKIAMDSGTENLDWTARVLRRLVEFTQAGGEVNVVVCGTNVGAQSYWNAEATMLMHTSGILIMLPAGAMVLTGKRALDYSGGVSAEDHQGIGGHERIMGPNGQSQYWAEDIGEACRILFRHYDHSYVKPGERWPRRAPTQDRSDRDIRSFPHGRIDGVGFSTVGDVLSTEKNPGRKKPFDIRRVMHSVIDQDQPPLERWQDMRHAEIAVVWDAHLGGFPVSLIGIESRPLSRLGFVPGDGPDHWTAGTLFPSSSKKVARAINASSGNRPLVILANLSGFDGSPESLRRLQLEYGAEIGRAVVNFNGPIVFCVISRYHGGAYVVFSRTLNENLQAVALEGSYASVIGGAPAAAVVFSQEVRRRTLADPRIEELQQQLDQGTADPGAVRAALRQLMDSIHSEKLGEVAEEFDRIHNVHRAKEVGSLDDVVPASQLRPYLIRAVERGMMRADEPAAE